MLLFINEDKEFGDRYFVFGRVVKDGSLKNVGSKGTPLLTLPVSTGLNEDLVHVNLWGVDAMAYNGIKKGATIIADCRESVREYNGKTYKNYTANFIMSTDELIAPSAQKTTGKRKAVEPEQTDGFTELFETNDLPW